MAESRFAFPVVMTYAIAVWLAAGVAENGNWLQLLLFVLSTLMMVALNNSNALIRIYSRMVSCSFIVMTCAQTFLFSSLRSAGVGLAFILFYLSLLRSYQDKRAPGIVFYSFACLGIASVFFVQILYFVPVLWILMSTNLMAMTHRMFWASILGIILPYWFAAGYYAYTGTLGDLADHFAQLWQFEPLLQYDAVDIHTITTFGIISLLSVIGIIHYMRKSYLDKIRTRMIFEMFITIDILAYIFVILQPQHFECLMPVITVNTSCLFAHFIALTKTRTTNIFFILACIMMVALTIFNIAL